MAYTKTMKVLLHPIKIVKEQLNIPRYYNSVLLVFDDYEHMMAYIQATKLYKEGEVAPTAELEITYDDNHVERLSN